MTFEKRKAEEVNFGALVEGLSPDALKLVYAMLVRDSVSRDEIRHVSFGMRERVVDTALQELKDKLLVIEEGLPTERRWRLYPDLKNYFMSKENT